MLTKDDYFLELDGDTVKQSSVAAYLLYEWLVSAIELRTQSVLERRAKKLEVEDMEEDADDEETLSDKEDTEGDDAFGGTNPTPSEGDENGDDDGDDDNADE